MFEAPFAVALAAGALAAVNPCGFALLPAYVTFLVTGDGDQKPSRTTTLLRALGLTAAMTLGFVAVFGAFGLVVAPVAPQITEHLPWVTIVIGCLLAAAGVWLLLGKDLPSFVPKIGGTKVTRSFTSMAVFGAAFAIASLGCTIAPFLAVVVSTLRSGSILTGQLLFVTYAIGMGLVIGAVSVAVALARDGLVRSARRMLPIVGRISGAILVIVGGYVGYYGWYEVRVYRGGSAEDPIIDAASVVQGWLADLIAWIF